VRTRESKTPFLKILHLAAGDFLAKTLNFCTFVFLARVLGVANYGVLEFSVSSSLYFLIIADAGIESWATREVSKGENVLAIVSRVLPLRLILAATSFAVLALLVPLFPEYPQLPGLLLLFGLGSFTQALSLKWAFLGGQQMGKVSKGLVMMPFVFAALVIGWIRAPEQVIWVPVFRIAGELAMVLYFWFSFRKAYGSFSLKLTRENAIAILGPSLVLGGTSLLGLMNYNFDSVLLGFLIGPRAVGLYNAAYKPVTVALAMPVTFFVGLFPILSRAYSAGQDEFRETMNRSFHLAAIFAVPVVIGGFFLAKPMILFVFGSSYAESIPVLQILIWSASFVALRGTFRHGLVAAGKQGLDFRCALTAALTNVALNIVLIPRYGPAGAAAATVSSELSWLLVSSYYFHRYVAPARLIPFLTRPILAGAIMALFLSMTAFLPWMIRGTSSVLLYSGALYLLHRFPSKMSFW
jgi:O-antigen/teichoic acid export membrane protein